MAAPVTTALAAGAALLGGLVAGPALNRIVVETPAWREIGVVPWAAFTRAADLGPGVVLYPSVGVGAMLLCVAGAVALYLDRSAPRAARAPADAAAVLAVGAFLVTGRLLAPVVLGVRHAGSDPAALAAAFAMVARWWRVKAALHLLTFGANVWTLVALARPAAVARS